MDQTAERQQAVRFIGAGLLNTALSLAIFAALFFVGLSKEAALIGTFAIGIVMAYFLQTRLVFQKLKQPRYLAFLTVYLLSYLTNRVLLDLLVNAGLHPVVAQSGLVVLSAAITFVGLSVVFYGRVPFLNLTVGPPLGPRP